MEARRRFRSIRDGLFDERTFTNGLRDETAGPIRAPI